MEKSNLNLSARFTRNTKGNLARLCCALIVGVLAMQCSPRQPLPEEQPIALIPQPIQLQPDAGQFTLNKETTLHSKGKEASGVAAYLADMISDASTFALKSDSTGDASQNNSILLEISGTGGPEHYSLTVTPTQIHIQASDAVGLFYGVQTLRQLLPAAVEKKNKATEAWSVPAVSIQDQPAFAWRGMHLDVSRHFFSVEFIKQFIDRLSLYKFNTLHLHLSDDQGWRLQINRYPELTEKGAWRVLNNQDSVCLDKATTNPDFALPEEFFKTENGVKVYGGYYSQENIRDIVAYAQKRFITIVPEIDMPGHMNAAIPSFPDLTCIDQGGWGKLFTVPLCPCEETTYAFVENVLSEVASLFPGQYIHIGADEVDESSWLKSKPCAALLKEKKWKTSRELHSYFVNRVNAIVTKLGKKTIGWDEIVDGKVDSTITVMYWRGWVPNAPAVAASRGHNVIMSPTSHCYFDYEQDEKTTEHVYSFNPVPEQLTGTDATKIIGLQANIWTEYIPTVARLDYQTMPRMMALAEAAWNTTKDWNSFNERLQQHYSRLDQMNIKYRLPDLPALEKHVVFTDTAQLALTLPVGVVETRFTTNGGEPTTRYEHPIRIDSTTTVNLLTVGSGERPGNRYTIRFEQQTYLAAVSTQDLLPGLSCRYFEGPSYNSVSKIDAKDFKKQTVAPNISLPTYPKANSFGLIFEGFIDVPAEGIYTFYLTSDDGSVLQIGDRMVVNDDGYHSAREVSGQIALAKGVHPITLKYFEGGGGGSLRLLYKGPGIDKQGIPDGVLKRSK
ncbi:family 20 glycosylhydrolase [Chryseolinea lacunae]|uniref:beta-N-acetylhexosaminidase n=1 Tax=Chryseolinea lacunae TaxID=2801331 RepID=A0ABS1L2G3_9BACT|nr:family 20 glycosylhydrolase [Chryseolinea lacunae]MBL0745871.1 family 20 glycosylhydrolase [Chryseolinea lacunae]